MKIVTPQQMQELDRRAQSEHGISAETLMLNAGRCIAERIDALVLEKGLNRRLAVFAGKGNNAGDAFCLAALLPKGYDVTLICLFGADTLSPCARRYFDKIPSADAHIETAFVSSADDFLPLVPKVTACDIVIDGLLGTGFAGEISGTLKTAVQFINALNKKTVVAIDIPSGLNAETGQPSPVAVAADVTVTMGFPKTGMFLKEGPGHCGSIAVADIGLPAPLVREVKTSTELLTAADLAPLHMKRKRVSHKGDYGHLLVLAGSYGMSGAGYLAAMAALRGGAGLVTLGVPESLYNAVASLAPEPMVLPLPETEHLSISPEALPLIEKAIGGFDAVLIGPGMSRHPETAQFVQEFVSSCVKPIVIDADALNAISEDLSVLDRARNKGEIVLTPHIGEFSRLSGISKVSIIDRMHEAAPRFAAAHSVTLVLKGYRTIVTDGKRTWINSTGNPGMATAGMGDVLGGIVASLIGQNFPAVDAARSGVFLHGRAGDIAAGETGEEGLIASDVIRKIPAAIRELVGA